QPAARVVHPDDVDAPVVVEVELLPGDASARIPQDPDIGLAVMIAILAIRAAWDPAADLLRRLSRNRRGTDGVRRLGSAACQGKEQEPAALHSQKRIKIED